MIVPQNSCIGNLIPRVMCYRYLEVGPQGGDEESQDGPRKGIGGVMGRVELGCSSVVCLVCVRLWDCPLLLRRRRKRSRRRGDRVPSWHTRPVLFS